MLLNASIAMLAASTLFSLAQAAAPKSSSTSSVHSGSASHASSASTSASAVPSIAPSNSTTNTSIAYLAVSEYVSYSGMAQSNITVNDASTLNIRATCAIRGITVHPDVDALGLAGTAATTAASNLTGPPVPLGVQVPCDPPTWQYSLVTYDSPLVFSVNFSHAVTFGSTTYTHSIILPYNCAVPSLLCVLPSRGGEAPYVLAPAGWKGDPAD